MPAGWLHARPRPPPRPQLQETPFCLEEPGPLRHHRLYMSDVREPRLPLAALGPRLSLRMGQQSAVGARAAGGAVQYVCQFVYDHAGMTLGMLTT